MAKKTVDEATAAVVIQAARERAAEIAVPMNIAVVCAGAHLKTFLRMDNAWLGSIEIACNKAYSARAFDMSTKDLATIAKPGAPAYGIESSTDHRIAIFPGGVPLTSGDDIVGAIGVSGGTPDQDHEVAEAGAKAFGKL